MCALLQKFIGSCLLQFSGAADKASSNTGIAASYICLGVLCGATMQCIANDSKTLFFPQDCNVAFQRYVPNITISNSSLEFRNPSEIYAKVAFLRNLPDNEIILWIS